MKFYVYTSVDKNYEFIDSDVIHDFAIHEFDPTRMDFSGIVIEAEDLAKAYQVYNNPACGFGEYIFADEPLETASKKELIKAKVNIEESYKKLAIKLDFLRCTLIMKLAACRLQEANILMNQVCQGIYEIYDKPKHITPETIFNAISQKAVEVTIKYDGKSKKS